MADARLYMEAVKGDSPTRGSANIRGAGKTQSRWYIGQAGDSTRTPVTTVNEFYKALIELLGTTHTHSDGVRLKRIPPKADPFMQYYYCEDVQWHGIGRPTTSAATPLGQLEVPSFDNVTIYPSYAFDCTFSPRPYTLIQDETLPSRSVRWYDDRGQDKGSFDYAEEWLRYTDVEMIPAGEYVTAQGGQFIVDVASGAEPDGVAAIQGQVRMFVKKCGVKLTWYQVPYVYVDPAGTQTKLNRLPWILQALGHVNQYNWWNYAKGTLLLEAVGVVRYSPVVPKPIFWGGSTQIFSNAKLCDLTFVFSYFDPGYELEPVNIWTYYGKDSAGNTATPRAPKNNNIITQGHNQVAIAHRMAWYFAKTVNQQVSDNDGEPIYPSFPYELIFTNPGVVQ